MVIFKILPDLDITNEGVSSFLTNVHHFKQLRDRVNWWGKTLTHSNNIVYEIVLTKKDNSFHIIVPDDYADTVYNELNVCWPKATFKKTVDYMCMFNIKAAAELELREHFFMSIKVDKRGLFPLSNLLETSRMLVDDERVIIQMILKPTDDRWYEDVENSIKDFNAGHMTSRLAIGDYSGLKRQAAKLVYGASMEVLSLISYFLTNEELEQESIDKYMYANYFRQGLSHNTCKKSQYLAYDTTIRIAVDSTGDAERLDFLERGFTRAFNSVTEDNGFKVQETDLKQLSKYIKNRKPFIKINKDLLSVHELTQLIQMPTKHFQQLYHIENINTRELELPKAFTEGGLQLGHTTFRGVRMPAYIPISDYDMLCRFWCYIGEMGTGKTTAGENVAIQALQNGFGVCAIDVADGRLIDNITKALPRSFNKIINLDFGDVEHPIPLAWTELGAEDDSIGVENRISAQLKTFLSKFSYTATSDRMEKYLGAIARAVFKNPQASLYDVILGLTSKKFRDQLIADYNITGRLKFTLNQLDDPKTGETKTQYVVGILDRLEALIDNEYVSNCLLQKANPEINFRKWLDEGYFIGVRIPKDVLLDDATDLLVTYTVSKLWLAILSRHNIPVEKRNPAFLLLDEPHQFPSVLVLLKDIIREMRKWRLGIMCFAHNFKDYSYMQSIMMSAGTNYIIYNTSKETYNILHEELAPFTIEELMATKQHHAVVRMKSDEGQICFMCDMMDSLSKKPGCVPRTIPNVYGRPVALVEEEVFERVNAL